MDRKQLIQELQELTKTLWDGEPEIKVQMGRLKVGIEGLTFDINNNTIILELDLSLKGTRFEESATNPKTDIRSQPRE